MRFDENHFTCQCKNKTKQKKKTKKKGLRVSDFELLLVVLSNIMAVTGIKYVNKLLAI